MVVIAIPEGMSVFLTRLPIKCDFLAFLIQKVRKIAWKVFEQTRKMRGFWLPKIQSIKSNWIFKFGLFLSMHKTVFNFSRDTFDDEL